MRFIGITTVRNESDIIEAFIRHNLRYLDYLIILDDFSSDSTPVILNKLITEGLPITVRRTSDQQHRQANKLTKLLRELSDQQDVTHAFPLDADEFLVAPSRESLELSLKSVATNHCLHLPWMTYVPTEKDNLSELNAIRRIAYRKAKEIPQAYKLAVSRTFFATGHLHEGNHGIYDANGKTVPTDTDDSIYIAHFPVRSESQLISKILLGEWSLEMKPERYKGEGCHWEKLAEQFREDPQITPEMLTNIANKYAESEETPLTHDPLVVSSDLVLKYDNLINVDLCQRLIAYTDQLVKSNTAKNKIVLRTKAVAVNECRHGPFAYHLNDTVIGRSMMIYGEWGEHEIALINRIVQPGSYVLDAGANIGTHTIPLARMVGSNGIVIAFEPQRLTYQLLCANVSLNSFANVFTHHAALGAETGLINVPFASLNTPTNIGNLNIEGHSTGERVSMVTIDQMELPRLDFLKIDVEGMESQILTGATTTLKRCQTIIFVENNIEENSVALIQKILDLGYKCWWHFAEYYNPDNYFGVHQNIFADVDRPEINMLCMPAHMEMPINGLVPVLGAEDTWQAGLQRSNENG
jgi:FkbM family methyltransferase